MPITIERVLVATDFSRAGQRAARVAAEWDVTPYRADLLVVGARGERDADGERVLGGTSAKLLSTADTPLLLVRRGREDPVASVVAAVDLSPRSRAVLEWADFAAAGRHLHAFHVYEVPFTARLEAYGLSASAIDAYSEQARSQHDADLTALVTALARAGGTSHVVERGEPAALLSRHIESVRPSLVVLGRHVGGKRSSPPSRVGSVSRFIASSASADVLVV